MSALFSPFMAMLGGITEYASKETMLSLAEVFGPALIGLAVLFRLGIKRFWAKRMASKQMTRDQQIIVQLYRRMISHLARKGIFKLAAMPPLEFVRITQERWSNASSSVASITELYCRTRFGQIPPTREELTLAEDHLRYLMALDKP